MQEDAFGLPLTPVEDQVAAWLDDADPAVNEAQTEEQTTPPTEEVPAPQAADPAIPQAQVTEQPVEQTEAQKEEARKWANKYESPDELERGYRELSDLWRRTSETSRVNEQRAAEAEARAQRLQAEMARIVPVVQNVIAQQQALAQRPQTPQFDEYGQPIAQTQPQQPQPVVPSPQQLQAFIEQRVNEQSAQREAAMRAEIEAQRRAMEDANTVQTWFAENGITRGDETDQKMVDTIKFLNSAWTDGEVELGNRESLAIIKEAAERPALREVFALKPEYFDTDAGIQLARMEASVLEGNAPTQQLQSVPASQVGQTNGQRQPVIERAAGGAGAGTVNPQGDPWLEAVAFHRGNEDQKRSVFFE